MERRTKIRVGVAAAVLAAVAVVASVASCASRLPEDDAAVTALVAGWLPAGTTAADAQRILEDHGFETARHAARSQSNPGPDEVLWADRMQTAGWPVMRRFQVTAVLDGDRVAKVTVSSGLVGP